MPIKNYLWVDIGDAFALLGIMAFVNLVASEVVFADNDGLLLLRVLADKGLLGGLSETHNAYNGLNI